LEGSSYARHDQSSCPSLFPLFVGYYSLLDSMSYFFISHTIRPTDLLYPSPTQHFTTFQVFLTYFLKCPNFSTILQMQFCRLLVPTLNLSPICSEKSIFPVECCFAIAILGFISRVHLHHLLSCYQNSRNIPQSVQLCSLLNNPHLFSLTQHRFILIQFVTCTCVLLVYSFVRFLYWHA